MSKKGRLSLVEKYAIQQMLHDNMTTEEIASILNRSQKSVQNYIDGELDQIHEHIAKAKMQEVSSDSVNTELQTNIGESDIEKAYRQLVHAGLLEKDADWVIAKTIKDFNESERQIINADHLFSECVKRMKAGHFMQKRTLGGNKGVAIMSGAASARTDDSLKGQKRQSRSTRGCIFNPNTGELS